MKWSCRPPSFKTEKQFCDGAISIENVKRKINVNGTINGAKILDLSKVLM